MAQALMIEGTVEEITRQLQQSHAGQKLRIFIEMEAEEEDFTVNLPDPPFAVRSHEQLLELLREGMNSPASKFTDESMEEIRQEVHRRYAARQKP